MRRDADSRNEFIESTLYHIHTVELHRRAGVGLGLCIGGRAGQSGGVFISRIIPNSVAFFDGRLETGDIILDVNGINLRTSSYEEATNFLKVPFTVVCIEFK